MGDLAAEGELLPRTSVADPERSEGGSGEVEERKDMAESFDALCFLAGSSSICMTTTDVSGTL